MSSNIEPSIEGNAGFTAGRGVSDAPQEFKLLPLYVALEGEYGEMMVSRLVQNLARRRVGRMLHEKCISMLMHVGPLQSCNFLLRICPGLTAVCCVWYDKSLKEFQAWAWFEMRDCERTSAVLSKC